MMIYMGEGQSLYTLSDIESIGEIMGTSMASAATALSTLIDCSVAITAPGVNVIQAGDFSADLQGPIISVNVKYVDGLSGSMILLLRKEDISVILSKMMYTDIPADFEIDEMMKSAICEAMNQMMGSSATVLSCFLSKTISIATPTITSVENWDRFRDETLAGVSHIVSTEFSLTIETEESQLITVMDIGLAREIIGASLKEEPEEKSEPAPLYEQPQAANGNTGAGGQPNMYPKQPPNPYNPYPPPGYTATPSVASPPPVASGIPKNLDLITKIPVSVTVELGRARKK
jgi:flagellar motor switch protein FliN/FliY